MILSTAQCNEKIRQNHIKLFSLLHIIIYNTNYHHYLQLNQ